MNDDEKEIILIFAESESEQLTYGSTRGLEKALQNVSAKAQAVTVATLRENMRGFLTAIDSVLRDAPKDVGGLALDEVEIRAQLDSKGNLGISGVLGIQTAMQGGIKFVLRKKL